MMKNKWIAALTACCIGAGALLSSSLLCTAENNQSTHVGDNTYTLSVVPERTSVSAEEVAEGNVTVHTKVYIKGNSDGIFTSAFLRCKTDSNQLYFRNLTTPNTKTETEQTYTYSGGTFSTKFLPYCFGKVSASGKYSTNCFLPSAADIANEPKFGADLYSDGKGGVYFTITYYTGYEKNEDGSYKLDSNGRYIRTGKTTETKYCDVTVDKDGTGHYSFDYLDQTYFNQLTCNATIPHFEANLPEGTKIPGTNDTLSWYAGDISNGANFLGESDEFPYMEMDLVIQQGTSNGVYTISFDDSYCKLNKVAKEYYNLDYEPAQITVGEPTVTVTEATLPSFLCYASSDLTPISPADFYADQADTKIMATLSYADGTTETKDITDVVRGDGSTASALYAQQSDPYCSVEVPLFYGSQPLIDADGNAITQKILIGKKGDVNFDGDVGLEDATLTLTYYSEHATNNTFWFYDDIAKEPELETLAYFLADIDTGSQNYGADGGVIELSDATQILTYYSERAVGNQPYWDDLLK